jgi:V/A-type H+/Na+-transporting ATPase subunit I
VSERLDQLELMRRLGGSEHAFVIAGWLPRREFGRLEAALAELDDEVAAIEIAPRAGEEPPVALANSRAARPFERLVRLFGLPQARSIDPSGLMSVFMPLFFGMMVGDVGHGVILLAGALAARRRWRDRPMIRDLARILALGAGWSVVWGLVFGELFGELGAHYLHLSPLWISRSDSRAVSSLLVFSLGVGAVHIALGLVLGIWSAARARHRSELCERAGQLVSLVGLFSVAGVISRQLPAGLMTPSFAAIAVGMVLVGATKGWLGLLLGPLDVLSGAGNVLSYLRIAALGMASVYLSQVANELGRAAPAVIGAVVATLLHALNVALASFSPTIQALRLHYVEFFGKFYDVGGAPYRPFGAAVADAET